MPDLLRPDLDRLARALPPRPRTRYAPSPTGYLHLGHVVNAIYVWGVARTLGGHVVVRIEDHDRIRSRPEYDAALREDLAWLGFTGDEPICRQSDDPAAYDTALRTLARSHPVYACDCSRRDIAAASDAPGDEGRYTGRCRTRGLDADGGCGLRVVIEPGLERFDDALQGEQVQDPAAQCGDLLLRDRDGHWTYQFAVTVDDVRQRIDLVIRGADLLTSTGRQIRLARMLGRIAPAAFLHHPILLKPGGQKLSKSSGDTGVRDLRAAGLSAPEVIGRAAAAVGLIDAARPIVASEVEQLFLAS
jgi:glutamyl-tRNA synthetase/glutamyl-Q tRNA(Asp) synthetase